MHELLMFEVYVLLLAFSRSQKPCLNPIILGVTQLCYKVVLKAFYKLRYPCGMPIFII